MSDLRRATQELPALLANIKRLETAVKALAVEGVYVIRAEAVTNFRGDFPARIHVSALPSGGSGVHSEVCGAYAHVYTEWMGVTLVCLYPIETQAAAA